MPVHVCFFGADCVAKLDLLRRLISTESFGPKPRVALRLRGLRHRRLGTDAGHYTYARQAFGPRWRGTTEGLGEPVPVGTQNDFAGLIGIDGHPPTPPGCRVDRRRDLTHHARHFDGAVGHEHDVGVPIDEFVGEVRSCVRLDLPII